MGYNTSVIVLNDALNDIEHDPEFGKKLSRAVIAAASGPSFRQPWDLDVSARGHCNAASVIETHHADQTTLVSFGGNMGVEQHRTYGWAHNEVATQVLMCRQWAAKLGFRLVAIPKVEQPELFKG